MWTQNTTHAVVLAETAPSNETVSSAAVETQRRGSDELLPAVRRLQREMRNVNVLRGLCARARAETIDKTTQIVNNHEWGVQPWPKRRKRKNDKPYCIQ